MAVLASTITSFAAIGVPTAVGNFDLFESTTAAKLPLGFKVEDVSGNIYRWGHFGAATTSGLVVSQDISESTVADSDNVILAPASCVNTTDGTIGSRFVEITLATVTANQYAGGKFITTDDAGEGYTYPIIGNTATDDPASGTIRLELGKPLQVALTAATDFTIIGNPYGNLEPATAATDFVPVGVALATQAADDYGWVQTKGTVGIYSTTTGADTIVTAAKGIKVSAVTAGTVTSATATNDNVFGYCITAPDTTGMGGYKINCE